MLYNSLAESHIQYGLSSYGRTYKSYLQDIYKLQLKILKNIVPYKIKSMYHDNEMALFKYCSVLPIFLQVKYVLLKEHFFNTNIQDKIEHPIYTRAVANSRLCVRHAHNVYGERMATYMVPRIINELLPEVRNIITTSNIKHKLKSYFISTL